MNTKIVHSESPVLLVGGGRCADAALTKALSDTKCAVAADGGAAELLARGHMPDSVIGDMDSLSTELQARLAPGVLQHIAEQDSTDFDKCLRHIEAPLVLAHGFLGARVDHQLAVFNVLVRRADRRCVLVGEDDIVLLCPPKLQLNLPKGLRFSLFPMTNLRGTSLGLRWPIDGIDFSPNTRIGTSNEVSGPVALEMEAPGMLLILPPEALDPVLDGLQSAPLTWPARAE
ncbi:Thiamine pyrophosphokinase [Pelagimonas phthalicica]|uniref:Thiamine diphosphokinase n=1 Tax=Pelagimonas phthalicica TaxID=1037362 RepID=A0A238JAR2_9RHOB|nr:thiamine diphosphokinase [Pelagimonas phthalicica]TDS93687.1 thiamine pyrophosphokinase [Pelagimonas phthalicica]SMX27790.1 Thiamine pyrophosphokinase [Pelagimonas phthalicica]